VETDDRILISREPLNAETPLGRQVGTITPLRRHFVRTHFPTPRPPDRLVIDGALRAPLAFSADDIRAFPSRSLVVTLECAGNGRSFLDPLVPGEPWRLGAVSTGEWTGVPLRLLLELAAPTARAVEVVFRGADRGTPSELNRPIAYERSLRLREALDSDALLAYAVNGEELPPEHGAPLRLVVPGAYGMASVKWLERITLLERPLAAFYQTERYVIGGVPLGPVAPRAIIVDPIDGAMLPRRPLLLRGYAWSGHAPIAMVEVSDDGGRTWAAARLSEAHSPYAWREWQFAYDPTDRDGVSFLPRATDAAGNEQPLAPRWNTLGYANNAARPTSVRFG
jgi:DMSO/TMAO reductase YedYZ molybdopterin-dependent catalytic subunit